MTLLSQLDRLLPEVVTKYNRYSVADAGGNRLLNFAGFKYLLHSCPSLFFRGGDEGQIAALFAQAAAAAAANNNNNNSSSAMTTTSSSTNNSSKAAKLTFDAFVAALVTIGKEMFPEDAATDEATQYDQLSNTSSSSTLPVICYSFPKCLLRLLSVHVLPSHSEDLDILTLLNPDSAKDAMSSSMLTERLLSSSSKRASSSTYSSPLSSSRNNEANSSTLATETLSKSPSSSSSSSSLTYSSLSRESAGGRGGGLIVSMSPVVPSDNSSTSPSSSQFQSQHSAGVMQQQAYAVVHPPILPSSSFSSSSSSSSSSLVDHNINRVAVSSSASSIAQSQSSSLMVFLTSLRLESFLPALERLGAERIEDLKDVNDVELDAMGMRELHKRRLRDALLVSSNGGFVPLTKSSSSSPLITSNYSSRGASPSVFSSSSSSSSSGANAAVEMMNNGRDQENSSMVQASIDHAVKEAELEHRFAQLEARGEELKVSLLQQEALDQAAKLLNEAELVHAAAIAPSSTSPSSSSSSSPSSSSSSSSSSSLVYEWEQYATPEGVIYYFRPASNTTQWEPPPAGSTVRTVAARHAEKVQLQLAVETKMRKVLESAQRGRLAASQLNQHQQQQQHHRSSPTTTSAIGNTHSHSFQNQQQHHQQQQQQRQGSSRVVSFVLDQAPSSSSSSSSSVSQVEEEWRSAWNDVIEKNAEAERLIQQVEAANEIDEQEESERDNHHHHHNQHNHPSSSSLSSSLRKSKGPLKNAPMTVNSSTSRSFVQSNVSSSLNELNFYDQEDDEGNGDGNGGGGSSSDNNLSRTSLTINSAQKMKDEVLAIFVPESATSSFSSNYLALAPSGLATPRNYAANQLARRRCAALATREGGTADVSIADAYADVFADMPMMDPATMEIIARSHSIANSRVMGYADPRPDLRPNSIFGAHADHAGSKLSLATQVRGQGGRSIQDFANGLRQVLYTPNKDPFAPRTAAEMTSSFGKSDSVAPSSAVTGYAYRHAAAVSRWAGQGTVVDRLTDTRGYTGAHKHRFDSDGRGRGIAGREV